MHPGIYAEMPQFTSDELAEKSAGDLLDKPYVDAGVTAEDRLIFSDEVWNAMAATGRITVPLDAASEVNLPSEGRKTPIVTADNPMSDDDAARWRAMGYLVDQLNRPVNPRAGQVITTPGFGMLTGMGKYWKIGPNFIGNGGLRTRRLGRARYLMTRVNRGRGDVWGVPGGHTDDSDTSVEHTALRETEEEAGIPQTLIEQLRDTGQVSHFVHRDWPQANRGATMNAWQEGEFHFYSPTKRHVNRLLAKLTLATTDPEEVNKIAWVRLKDIRSGTVNVMGSHKEAIEAHEEHLKLQRSHRLRQRLSRTALAA